MKFISPYFGFKSHRDKVQIHGQTQVFVMTECFKSHRDKVQIGESANEAGVHRGFKSHRDKVQISFWAGNSGRYKVSNPIGTKFKSCNISTCITRETLFQIPQGQSSNETGQVQDKNGKLFQIPQGQSSNRLKPLNKFMIYFVSNPIGTKFKCYINNYFFVKYLKVSNPIGTKFKSCK